MYEAKVLADSVSQEGYRLTTFEVTFPRIVLAEVNTHRVLSRNSASSRAIPVKKAIAMVEDDPFIPQAFVRNQPGMSGDNVLDDDAGREALRTWNEATIDALYHANRLEELEVHKALANRILEPFKWHTAIVSGTEWDNFFALRTDAQAQPEFREAALLMQDAYEDSTPERFGRALRVQDGCAWHLPLVRPEEYLGDAYPEYDANDPLNWVRHWDYWKKVSVGRCARVSYLTHDGVRDPDKDVELHDKLKSNGHLSPFEHVARPFSYDEWETIRELQAEIARTLQLPREVRAQMCDQVEFRGNFRGWAQYRKDIPYESNARELFSAIAA